MVRTILVLVFLAFCGTYFYQQGQPEQVAPAPVDTPRKVDVSGLEALKRTLPSRLFEKDVQPSIDQNRKQGLTSAELDELLVKLERIGRALDSKTGEAVDKALKSLEASLPPRKDTAERTAEAAGNIARSVGQGVKESMPFVKELASDLLRGMATVLSQVLETAADLLKK